MTSHTTSTSTGGGSNPSAWPADTLDRFGAADEIDISTRRDDDNLRGFVPIRTSRRRHPATHPANLTQ
jgi:hypothetical protein